MSAFSPGCERWHMTPAHRMVINRARRLARKVNLGTNADGAKAELFDLVDAVARLLAQEKREATRRPCDHGEAQCAGEVEQGNWCEDLAY